MNKLSDYNYFVPYQNRIIYFNGITNSILSLSIKEHQKVEFLFSDLISFEINYKSVFEYFKSQGFIIQDDVNELDIIKYRNRREVFDNRQYSIFINPTLECNFNCWYCYEEHPDGFMQPETIEKIKIHLKYMIEQERITALHLSWFGGEPLLYFDEVVCPISEFAKNLCMQNHIPFFNAITTNGWFIDEDMVLKFQDIDLSVFQITIDGDEKKHNKVRNDHGTPSFTRIINNIQKLCDMMENVHITLRVNYDDITLQKSDMLSVFQLFTPLQRRKIKVDFQRVWQTRKGILNENSIRIKLYNECVNMGFQHVGVNENVYVIGRYHKCYVDSFYHSEFNYDGKVFRCTVRGYADKFVEGKLLNNGRIEWSEDKMVKRYGKATFENDMCIKCHYLPLCMGPCSQVVIENSNEKLEAMCPLNNCEVKPETAIIDYYERKMKFLGKKIKYNG